MSKIALTAFEGTPYADMIEESGKFVYAHGKCSKADQDEYLEYVTQDLYGFGYKLTNIARTPDRITGKVERVCPECKDAGFVPLDHLYDGVDPLSADVECPSCTPESMLQHEASRANGPW